MDIQFLALLYRGFKANITNQPLRTLDCARPVGRGVALGGLLVALSGMAVGPVAAQTQSASPGSGPLYARIQAVRVADGNGKRAARVTPPQVEQWVRFANRVFASANIQFQFSPGAGDFIDLKSNLLNNLTGAEDPDWDARKRAGNALAAKHRGKLLVLFRHGPGPSATGGGFSWWDYNFVVMPGFDDASHCGHPHTDALAHELGHFLGLPHTFAGSYNSTAEAEAALLKANNKLQVFDGDGFSDTPPDPLIRSLECERTQRITLHGTAFPLPRANIMSYYDERNALSPMQVARVRWILQTRMRRGMAMPSNFTARMPLEAEQLRVEPGANWIGSVQSMAGFGKDCWSGNQQLFFPGNPTGTVSFQLPVPAAGSYRVDLYATQAPDFGRVRVHLDGKPVGAVFDAYAPVVIPSGQVSLGTNQLNQGVHQLRVEMIGKNPASSNFGFGLDCIGLVPLGNGSPK